jgi:C-terminal processing protease CtpA/Prc
MKNSRKISIVLVAVTALLTCRQASAQYFFIPWYPDVCGGYSDEWSAKCHRDDNGNMIDGRTGDVYDKNGNFLRHGGAKSREQPRNNNNDTYRPNPNSSNSRRRSTGTQPEELIGVGLKLEQDKNTKKLTVVFPIDGTPAANVGILPKDVITQIDDLSTQGMTAEQAAKLIRGTAGTAVTLSILRNGRPLKFRLTRVKITVQAQSNNP